MRSCRFYFSPLFVLAVLLALLFHAEEEFIILFGITLIHELGHMVAALGLGVRVRSFGIHLYGCSVDLENLTYAAFPRQIVIYLAGPATFFITCAVAYALKACGWITEYQAALCFRDNLSVALFNLLPLYPLDGGRILFAILNLTELVQKSIRIRNAYSAAAFFCASIMLCLRGQYVLFSVLAGICLLQWFSARREYETYLRERYSVAVPFESALTSGSGIFHFRRNYYLRGQQIVSEEEMIPELLLESAPKNRRKKKKRQ